MKKIKRLFLLSHCDDEIFLLPFLLDSRAESTVFFFSTTQVSNGPESIRKIEALEANRFFNHFQKLETVFLEPEVRDGKIYEDFASDNFRSLVEIIDRTKPDEVVTLAYEGGHQDHDAVEAISKLLCETKGLQLITCPAYRASTFSKKFFRVMKSELREERIKVKRLLSVWVALRVMFIYKSQIKTWFGLAPFILKNYAFSAFWIMRVTSFSEPKELDRCFYEFRDRATQSEVIEHFRRIRELSGNVG
jgi:LmbE family N-acetylglucosaminyl deacetylase